MSIKIIGAAFVIAACGSFGFLLAANHRREEKTLRLLISALDFMECELQYRQTPLPDLCRQTAKESNGAICKILSDLADKLDSQISPDASTCMNAVIQENGNIPQITKRCLRELGTTLGRFDLNGQLKGLEAVRTACRVELEALSKNRDERLRSYQTLGLCAGAAMAILFI